MPSSMSGHILLKSFLLLLFLSASKIAFTQSDPLIRKWFLDDKTAKIEIYKEADNRYYGKVIWLKKPAINGKQKVDIHNPDTSKRRIPLLGLVVLKGFIKTAEGLYEKGTIYDPKSGRTYSCKMSIVEGKLYVRGFYGISLFGKSTVWTKAE